MDALPRLPSFSNQKDTEPEQEKVSEETMKARKDFWAKFKRPISQSVLSPTPESPNPEPVPAVAPTPAPNPSQSVVAEPTPMLASPVPGDKPQVSESTVPTQPIMVPDSLVPPPDTPPDASGLSWKEFGMSTPTGASEPSPTKDTAVAAEGTGGEGVSENNSEHVAVALKRFSTVDLENGAVPGSLSKLTPEPTSTSTVVLMSVMGVQQPVTVNLTPEQCKAAGLQLMSEASASSRPTETAPPAPTPPAQTPAETVGSSAPAPPAGPAPTAAAETPTVTPAEDKSTPTPPEEAGVNVLKFRLLLSCMYIAHILYLNILNVVSCYNLCCCFLNLFWFSPKKLRRKLGMLHEHGFSAPRTATCFNNMFLSYIFVSS